MTTYTIRQGRYTKDNVLGRWGTTHQVPRLCGKPVSAHGGHPCENPPTWFQRGEWTCGHHRTDKQMPPNEPNNVWAYVPKNQSNGAPPTINLQQPVDPFEPFECTICFDTCHTVRDSYITPCNHSFHMNCMRKWATTGRSVLSCPMCRSVISNNPFGVQRRTRRIPAPLVGI